MSMSQVPLDMDNLDDRDRAVLRVLADGRANPKLIRDATDLSKGDANTVLVRLGRGGLVRQITRGLYEITPDGREAIGDDTVHAQVREHLDRALAHQEWSAVEDARTLLEANDE